MSVHSVLCKCPQTAPRTSKMMCRPGKGLKDPCWWAAKHRRASDVTDHEQKRADKLMSKLFRMKAGVEQEVGPF